MLAEPNASQKWCVVIGLAHYHIGMAAFSSWRLKFCDTLFVEDLAEIAHELRIVLVLHLHQPGCLPNLNILRRYAEIA